jgi:hypothetical protein
MSNLKPGDSRMNTLHFIAFVTARERDRLLKIADQLNVSEDCLVSEAIRQIICFYEDFLQCRRLCLNASKGKPCRKSPPNILFLLILIGSL